MAEDRSLLRARARSAGECAPPRGRMRAAPAGRMRAAPARPAHAILYEANINEGARMAGVAEVTDNSFQAEVIESEVPVLVDFWAPWCGPCRMVSPVVEEIAQERGEQLKVVKVNIDENQNTAIQYNVMSIPTLMLSRNGEVAKTVVGAYPKRKLEAELEPALA
jgi:thioredoxin 1